MGSGPCTLVPGCGPETSVVSVARVCARRGHQLCLLALVCAAQWSRLHDERLQVLLAVLHRSSASQVNEDQHLALGVLGHVVYDLQATISAVYGQPDRQLGMLTATVSIASYGTCRLCFALCMRSWVAPKPSLNLPLTQRGGQSCVGACTGCSIEHNTWEPGTAGPGSRSCPPLPQTRSGTGAHLLPLPASASALMLVWQHLMP